MVGGLTNLRDMILIRTQKVTYSVENVEWNIEVSLSLYNCHLFGNI